MITEIERKNKAAEIYMNRILQVLDLKFKVNITVGITYHIAHKFIVIALQVNPIYVKQVVNLAEEFGTACGVPTPRVYRHLQAIMIEIPLPIAFQDRVDIEDIMPSIEQNSLNIPLGVLSHGSPVYLDFNFPLTAHLLVSGKTGSGKSTLVKWLVYSIMLQNTPDEVKFAFMDLAGGDDFEPFKDSIYNLHAGILTEIEEAEAVLSYIEAEAKRRSQTKKTTPAIFLFLDEAQVLLAKEGYPKRFAKFASVYRKRGMHLVVITQDPLLHNLGDLGIRKNSVMIAGRMGGSRAASAALDLADTGANTLVGNGDFLIIDHNGVSRFTGVFLDERLIDIQTTNNFVIDIAEDLGTNGEVETYTNKRLPNSITEADLELVRLYKDDMSIRELQVKLALPGKAKRNYQTLKKMIKIVESEGYENE